MDYERGLRMLKEWIETGEVRSNTKILGVESVAPMQMVGIRKTCACSDIGPSMEAAFAEAEQKMGQSGLPIDGAAISVYHVFDMKRQMCDYTSGFVVPQETGSVPAELASWSAPAGRALRVEHLGSYEHLGNAWSAAQQVARYRKLKQSKVGAYEIYRNNPKETPASELRTEIFLPLK
jgi:effector-binding domain-containing protein